MTDIMESRDRAALEARVEEAEAAFAKERAQHVTDIQCAERRLMKVESRALAAEAEAERYGVVVRLAADQACRLLTAGAKHPCPEALPQYPGDWCVNCAARAALATKECDHE